MRAALATLLCGIPIATWPAAVHVPGAGGLEPCDSGLDGYYAEVDAIIATPPIGRVVGKFTAYPSFQTEWGLILFAANDAFTLRVIQFKSSVWYSAYQEILPGTFARDPAKAEHLREVDEIAISGELAQLIDQTLSKEISAAKAEYGRFGLDGEIYRFGLGGACAQTWSPDAGTRPAQLIEAMESLRTLSGVPTTWLRRMWEPSVIREWKVLAESNKAFQRTLEDARR